MVSIFTIFVMFYQFFLPEVKRDGIISSKRDIYELPDKLPNYLSLKI